MLPETHNNNTPKETIDAGVACFDSERELVNSAIALSGWRSEQKGAKVGVTTELETPNGIVDILFYRLRRDWIRHSVVGKIHSRWAFAFHQIPYRKQFSESDFAMLAGTSKRRALQALTEYQELDLCQRTSNKNSWVKSRQPLLAVTNLISVEAKLRNWQRALYQATRYLTYSDQSWVLLDHGSSAAAVKNLKKFEERNIGLATISKHGAIRYHSTPNQATSPRQHDRWFVNSELLKHLYVDR